MPAFQHIEFLYLLVLIPVLFALYFYALHKKKNTVKKLGDKDLIELLTSNHSTGKYRIKIFLVAIGMFFLIISLANPRSKTGSEKVNRNGIDVMIALDVSKSMLARDIQPTRLERAKQALSRMVDKLSNDRIGIVIFAGKAYLQMPLTADHAAAKMYLNAATTESVPTQGTVIGDALKTCFASFNANEKKYKAVILISDGEDHDDGAVKTAAEMGQEGILICTIGIGSPNGAPLMDENTNQYKTDIDGNTIVSKLNETTLIDIAEKGNGKYILFQSADDVVEKVVKALSGLEKRTVTDELTGNFKSFFLYFLLTAFIFLLIELFISEKKNKKNNYLKLKPATLFLFSFILFSGTVRAQKENQVIKQGNDAYRSNDFLKATDAYEQVVQKDPENAIAQFNLGNALFRVNKKEDAVIAYDKSIKYLKKPVEKSNAFYNKGVLLQKEKKLPECIEAYKNALKIDPDNEDARQNLQIALQQQKKQQQKQDQKKNKDQKKQEQDQKQEPKPQQSKITRKEAEEKLKALMQQEKNLQDKLHKVNAASVKKPEKDW